MRKLIRNTPPIVNDEAFVYGIPALKKLFYGALVKACSYFIVDGRPIRFILSHILICSNDQSNI